MIRTQIKPLSVNKAYKGRKFATDELKRYQFDLAMLLPNVVVPKGRLKVEYIFGISSTNGDGDNLIKAFQDCLATKYGFNDKFIYEWAVKKVDVAKGQEYIEWNIIEL